MATLRKWRPVEPQRKRGLTAENMIIGATAALIGLSVLLMLPGRYPGVINDGGLWKPPDEEQASAQPAAKPAAGAPDAEPMRDPDRLAAFYREQARQQLERDRIRLEQEIAARRNADAMPVGSITPDHQAPAATPAAGFNTVKRAAPVGGFREVAGRASSGR